MSKRIVDLREAMAKASRALTVSVANFNKAATAFGKACTRLNVIKGEKQNDTK